MSDIENSWPKDLWTRCSISKTTDSVTNSNAGIYWDHWELQKYCI